MNVFPVGDVYLFRHYFDGDEVFAALRPFYDRRRYRFEVPAEAFRDVRPTLREHGYDPVLVDDPAPFAVVVRKYRDHPENLFADAVLQLDADEHNVFVLADRDAVERAVADGATRLAATPLSIRLPPRPGVGPLTVRDLGDDRTR